MQVLDSSAQSESATSAQPSVSSDDAISILIVDSGLEQANSTCVSLRRVGLTASAVGDSASAIQFVAISTPHIVLLGSMPCAEGISLCHAIKQVAPDAILLVYAAQPEAWQLSDEFIAGVVPPSTRPQDLVEEICAWLTHRDPCCGDQKMRDSLAGFRLAGRAGE